MNPNANVFVPSFLKKQSQDEMSPKENHQSDNSKSEIKPPEKKEEKMEKKEPMNKTSEKNGPTKTETWEDNSYEPTQEELESELKRLALEEGRSVEDLKKEDEEEILETQEDQEEQKEHLNLVFVGHVDAGKSTLCGQILVLTGLIDLRTLEKYEREAKEKNRESWFLAYIMDTNEDERNRGKTVEVGRGHFETANKRFTILDAPGHKVYVRNMITGASQADIAILVISARRGEFESGFTKGGQTREHTMLIKTLGVKFLIIAINKMDEPTVQWEKKRYDEIVDLLTPFLKQVGWNVKKDVTFIPISAQKGFNIKDPMPKDACPWYKGPTLFEALDSISPIERLDDLPLRIPVIDKLRDGGKTWILGKVETGVISKGQTVCLMPNKQSFEVTDILTDTKSLKRARPGENLRIALRGLDEENVHSGFVVCHPKQLISCQEKFEAIVSVLDLLPHKSIFTAGYNAVLHIHSAVEECTVIVP